MRFLKTPWKREGVRREERSLLREAIVEVPR
jgi:hypothetical protein